MPSRIASFVLLIALGLAAAATADDSTKDLEKFAGTWEVTQVEQAGAQSPPDVLKQLNLRLVIKGNDYETFSGEMRIDTGTIKVDAGKKPSAVDVLPATGANAGKVIPAIYAFTGDELRICYDLSGQKRPTEFKSKAGTQEAYVVYKKSK